MTTVEVVVTVEIAGAATVIVVPEPMITEVPTTNVAVLVENGVTVI